MIPLKFGLFWSGSNLSYLRYLTFKSLRHFHPDAEIELYCSSYDGDKCKWHSEKQDFQTEDIVDHFDLLHDLKIKIIVDDRWSNYPPNFQSDFFRWWWLKENGGFYLDTDQIIMKSFEDLPLDNDIIYTHYSLSWGKEYYPVGVIGGSKDSEIIDFVDKVLPKYYNASDYNCLGPWGFGSIVNSKRWGDKECIVPPEYFYPIRESCFVPPYYENNIKLAEGAYALHWFGGLPESQKFNQSYSEDKAKENDDTISHLVRSMGLV